MFPYWLLLSSKFLFPLTLIIIVRNDNSPCSPFAPGKKKPQNRINLQTPLKCRYLCRGICAQQSSSLDIKLLMSALWQIDFGGLALYVHVCVYSQTESPPQSLHLLINREPLNFPSLIQTGCYLNYMSEKIPMFVNNERALGQTKCQNSNKN